MCVCVCVNNWVDGKYIQQYVWLTIEFTDVLLSRILSISARSNTQSKCRLFDGFLRELHGVPSVEYIVF